MNNAVANGFNTIYLSLDEYFDMKKLPAGNPDRKDFMNWHESDMNEFLSLAQAKNIQVDAEGGDKNWSVVGNREKALELMTLVSTFNKKRDFAFRGVQFDIEPFDVPNFEKDKTKILKSYLETVEVLGRKSVALGLPVSFAIPEFYADINSDNEVPILKYNGVTDTMYNHLLRILGKVPNSTLIVMAYSNRANGNTGSISIAKDEVTLSSQSTSPTRVIIAQETGDTGSSPNEKIPPDITFNGESKTYFFQELTKINEAFKNQKAYGGIAVHYLDTFLKLKNN